MNINLKKLLFPIKYVYKKVEYFTKTINVTKYKKKRLFIIGAQMKGNLGDSAIAYAEYVFCKKYFPDYEVILISSPHYKWDKKHFASRVLPEDIIGVTGGGFLGTLYVSEAAMATDVVKRFPNNRVLIFPQSVYFSEDSFGEQQKMHQIEIFKSHSNLKVFLRDKKSYDKMAFLLEDKNKIALVPDIVTYLTPENCGLSENVEKSTDVLLVFRNDAEKIFPLQQQKELILRLQKKYNVGFDTMATNYIMHSTEDMLRQIVNKMNAFSKSRVIITDRLHTMVFAAIAGVPCIAINTISDKVAGVYYWIKNLSYIRILDTKELINIEKHIDELKTYQNNKYRNDHLTSYFEQLATWIRYGNFEEK